MRRERNNEYRREYNNKLQEIFEVRGRNYGEMNEAVYKNKLMSEKEIMNIEENIIINYKKFLKLEVEIMVK